MNLLLGDLGIKKTIQDHRESERERYQIMTVGSLNDFLDPVTFKKKYKEVESQMHLNKKDLLERIGGAKKSKALAQ